MFVIIPVAFIFQFLRDTVTNIYDNFEKLKDIFLPEEPKNTGWASFKTTLPVLWDYNLNPQRINHRDGVPLKRRKE